jgi:GNAT superfamily N-acetyltransferase
VTYRFFLEIAKIHAAEIHSGALPLLGRRFLARLYFEIARSAMGGVWVAVDGDDVIGFLAGSGRVSATYRSVYLQGGVPLGWHCFWAVVTKPVLIRKIGAVLRYQLRKPRTDDAGDKGVPPQQPVAELLAIAVRSDAHRRGVGKSLVLAFEDFLRTKQVDGYFVTTNQATPESNRFYQMIGFEPCSLIKHHDLVLQQYHKLLGNLPAEHGKGEGTPYCGNPTAG